MGRHQRSFRIVGSDVRISGRPWCGHRCRRQERWDAHGSAFRTRQSDGRQRSEPGLGRGEKATAVDGGRSSGGIAFGADVLRNYAPQVLTPS